MKFISTEASNVCVYNFDLTRITFSTLVQSIFCNYTINNANTICLHFWRYEAKQKTIEDFIFIIYIKTVLEKILKAVLCLLGKPCLNSLTFSVFPVLLHFETVAGKS